MAIAQPKIPQWEKASGTLKRDEKIVRQLRLDLSLWTAPWPTANWNGRSGRSQCENVVQNCFAQRLPGISRWPQQSPRNRVLVPLSGWHARIAIVSHNTSGKRNPNQPHIVSNLQHWKGEQLASRNDSTEMGRQINANSRGHVRCKSSPQFPTGTAATFYLFPWPDVCRHMWWV